MQLLQERMKAMTKKETLNGNPEDALSAKPRRGSLLCNRQTYEKTFTSVKAWFVGAKANPYNVRNLAYLASEENDQNFI